MLEHLRQRVIAALAGVRRVTLTTSGAAGLQASHLPCQAVDTVLYVLVPRASDHLFNLESQAEVVVIDGHWQLKGQAKRIAPAAWPPGLRQQPEGGWSEAVAVTPTQLTLLRPDTQSPFETIDME
jgi:hypothetical protein